MNKIYQYIRGSKAHGISTPQSDTDMGGVFVCPNNQLLGLGADYKDEESDEKHDVVYWELNKFARLLTTSNPTVLEALFVDPEFVLVKDPAIVPFLEHRNKFLTKECFNPFGGYAVSQIKKARGLNKMIVQPILERKTPVDFCYVVTNLQVFSPTGSYTINDTMPVKDWLRMKHLNEDDISLSKLNHARDAYAIFIHPGGFCKDNGNDVHVNDIPKGLISESVLFFNKDAYTIHCKDYARQKEWEKNRNPVRYQSNLDKNYDAKNMSECFRLVQTCIEIANGDTYHVNRKGIDGEFLLDIRAHKFEYDELMDMLEGKISEMNKAIEASTIKESVDRDFVNQLVLDIRKFNN